MPYNFTLPTTSTLPISAYLHCESHPSLILAATSRRSVLRTALKEHKRLTPSSQPANLTNVLSALDSYLPYLFAIDCGLSDTPVGDEEVDVILDKELEVEWRASLARATPGRVAGRVKGRGLDYELCFVLTTLGFTYTLLARSKLHTLYASSTPSPEQRTAAITAATQYLRQANSVHAFTARRAADVSFPPGARDVTVQCQEALASVALAEATLLAILKDDPYPAVVTQSRNKDDKDWMFKSPNIPKVRAHLFARLGLQAAEYAGRAHSLLQGTADDTFVKYTKNLQRTARAKACRFFGIDAELGGKTGEGIGWLIGAQKELGYKVSEESSSQAKGLAKLKKNWTERKEDKKISKGEDWGSDAGRLEESRVIEMLDGKWNKSNDLISNQLIPASDQLMADLPSGREMYTTQPFHPPVLEADLLAGMRAPLDRDELARIEADSDGESDTDTAGVAAPGAFPGTVSAKDSTYY